jgi:beta-lactamase class A
VDGPKSVDQYIGELGIRGFHLEDSEHSMQRDSTAQYRNWLEPAAAVELLRRIADNSPLSPDHTRLLLQWMEEASTGANRLRAGLPPGTVLAHKTGTSGVHQGMAPATNDIGLITLPNGRRFAIAVFVTDSRASEAAREKVIANIGRAAYEAGIAESQEPR